MTKPQAFACRVFGERITTLLPLFKDMDTNLRKSRMRISFKAYVSLAILLTLMFSNSSLILVLFIQVFILHRSFFSSMIFGIGTSMITGALTVIGFYVYPIFRADNLKRSLEDELHFATGYLAILAGSGISPYKIFRSLAADTSLIASNEARKIVRHVELFGFDVLSALEAVSNRTSSVRFKELLEGFIATIHSGGNLTNYLIDRSRQYMELKQIALRSFSDALRILAEFYVTLLVTGPLILVVMLLVMAMLVGSQGFLDPRLLLHLLIYLGIPIGSIFFLIFLQVIWPRR